MDVPVAESGSITLELKTLKSLIDERTQKLVRFAHVKRQLREMRAEYNRLEEELFGAAAEEGL